MGDKWMQSAVNPAHKGAFSAKAEAAGMGTQEYASKVLSSDKASTQTKRQASLAKTFARFRPKKSKSLQEALKK